MIDLSEMEKGPINLPVDNSQALLEILRLTVSNQAMINALTNALLNEGSIFPKEERERIAEFIKEQHDSRFNEMWAIYLRAIYKS